MAHIIEVIRNSEAEAGSVLDGLFYSDVTAWRDWLIKEGKRPHTISTKLAILRSLFEYGCALGIFSLNPASAKLVPPPKSQNIRPAEPCHPKK